MWQTLLQYLPCECLAFLKRETIKINNHTLVVRKQLGEGGFSFVSLVEDAQTKELFALKKTCCQTAEKMKRAMLEIEVIRSLNKRNQPHVVRIYDDAVINGADDASDVYLVMDYFERGTLQDLLDAMQIDGRVFGEKEMLTMFLGACEAVLALHTNNPPYVHNDIKPGNLLVSKNGALVLTDFGSVSPARIVVKSRVQALNLQDFLESHSTPAYRAPEFFDIQSDSVLDERTDVWSLGCLLYAMAFGKSPFESSVSEVGGSLGLAIRSGRYKLPTSSAYSPAVEELIALMLKVDLNNRPFVSDVIRRIQDMI